MNEAFRAAFQVLNTGKPTLTSLGPEGERGPQFSDEREAEQRSTSSNL